MMFSYSVPIQEKLKLLLCIVIAYYIIMKFTICNGMFEFFLDDIYLCYEI